MSTIKLSEYTGDHVVLNDEFEYVDRLQELLDEGELDEEAEVFTVENEPIWGHIITAERVWSMFSDYLYDEVAGDESYDHGEEAARTALAEALNAWAAKHLTGTVLVETQTRVDISELFEGVSEKGGE